MEHATAIEISFHALAPTTIPTVDFVSVWCTNWRCWNDVQFVRFQSWRVL